MIKPTVGRAVWYRPNGADQAVHELPHHEDGPVPMSAQIAYVWNDRNVNLIVTDHTGITFPRSSVMLLQGDEDFKPRGAYAEWMPYQVGQAKPVVGRAMAGPAVGAVDPEILRRANDYAARVSTTCSFSAVVEERNRQVDLAVLSSEFPTIPEK